MLKAVVEKIEDAPETVRSFYKPREDGKFVLSVEESDGYALENISGLKSALGKERSTREQLERDVIRFKDIDPDKAREALAKWEEFQTIDPAKEADKIADTKFNAAKDQLVKRHGEELKGRDDRIARLTGAVDGLTRKQQATAAIAEAKGAVELLLPHVLAHTKVKETEAGDFLPQVVDAAGEVRFNSAGEPMTVKELVAEMRASDSFSRAFDGDGQSGSGKQPDKIGGTTKADVGGDKAARTAHFAKKFNLPR
jgi:hypothetical protein